jgi:transmembrane sensor
MEKNLLLHILSGEATSKEKEEFYLQLQADKQEEELFYQIKSLWIKASMKKTIVDTDSEFENLWRKIKHQSGPISFLLRKKILQYAAMILIVLSTGVTVGYLISGNIFRYPAESGTQKYTALKGSVSIIELPDGTKIWLNSGSELTYRVDLETKQRIAGLSGEAYFEVTHREDFPFLVHVDQLVVRDLGTTFNIKANPEDHYIETSLVEGKADILSAKGKSLVTLDPGESALYFPDEKKIELRSVSVDVLSAWREGKFVIRDQRLEDIVRELSRWYDVGFRFEDQKAREYRFTGNIKKSTTVRHVLKMLSLSAQFNYRIIEKPTGPDEIIIY